MTADLRLGDCVSVMASLPACSVDAIVTDPPYFLGFMGKEFDRQGGADSDPTVAHARHLAWTREALRVLSPGGHLIAFGGSRTVHRLTCAIEDAGFEIRDMGIWQFYSGFPKSLNLPGGRGTGLKPAHEPWILARKPLIGTVAANVLAHGTGALNVDACRYAYGDPAWPGPQDEPNVPQSDPANRSGVGGKAMQATGNAAKNHAAQAESIERLKRLGRWPANVYACPKASRSERERGCEGLTARTGAEATASKEGQARLDSPRTGAGRSADEVRNHHPTVKPVNLLRWLCRLVTPPGGIVLDCFLGSGTTGVAAVAEGFDFIGIEREPEYMAICEARIRHAARELGGGDTVDLFRQAPEVVVR